MVKKLRIGFVGVGNMGQCAHLRNYAALGEECEVVAVAELKAEQAKKVAARYGIPQVYADPRAMLEKEKPDAVVASQPFIRHGQLIPELLAFGIPVFTEKPLAGTVEMGEKIVRAAEKAKTFVMVGYHKRSDPATEYAKAEIERLKASGELGRLTYVRVLMPAGDWIAGGFTDLIRSDDPLPPLPADPPAADLDEEAYKQYVTFVNFYIHQVNLLRHLLGEPYQISFGDPSGVLLAGRSASGACCSLEMSPYRTSLDWQESALVCFERGWLRLELPAPLASNRPGKVVVFKDHPDRGISPHELVPQLPWVHAMRQQARNFLRAVRGEIAPLTSAAEALEDLKVARDYLRLWQGK